LSLLLSLEERRRQALVVAHQCMVRGEWSRALTLVVGADTLRSDRESKTLHALIALGERDFARAWGAYHKLNDPSPTAPERT
jgi:hypothetical protein